MKKYPVSETYEIVTEESAINGEAEESGFNFENMLMTAHEIADYLKENGFIFASSSYYHEGIWFRTQGEENIYRGACETRSLHFTNGMPKKLVKAICNLANINLNN